MIAPIWDSHPELNQEAGSSILLKLDSTCDEGRVIDEMRSYDERSLLFLRRLRGLNISVTPRPISSQKEFETRMCREGECSEQASTMVLKRNDAEKRYFVWRHQAETYKNEPLRPGITTSEIVLTFPYTIDEDEKLVPALHSQHAYAFLPIHNVGFNVGFLKPRLKSIPQIYSAVADYLTTVSYSFSCRLTSYCQLTATKSTSTPSGHRVPA